MDKDKALRMCRWALPWNWGATLELQAINASKEALAQLEQEPVAMRYDFDGYGWLYIDNGSGSNWKEKIKNAEPLYTTPPKRKWVGLTGPEVVEAYRSVSEKEWVIGGLDDARVFFCAIEYKLWEKNGC